MRNSTAALFDRLGNLRYRLLALILVPLLLLTGTVIALAANWSTDYTYQQLFTKVNTDLRVAHDSFFRIQTDLQRELQSLANSSALRKELNLNHSESLLALIQAERSFGEFDFLNLLSSDATKRLTANGWLNHELRESPLTQQVLNNDFQTYTGSNSTGIEVYNSNEWRRESDINAKKVVFPLIDTPRAAPTSREAEDRAMVIRSLLAVTDEKGARVAILEGGLLLNRNFAFVDEIRDLVYGPGSLAPGSRGTVTVFLDDVRITTNVPQSDTSRALGTRVSAEVRNTVLEKGVPWVDRAFVVNDWYISAYEPIVDVNGRRVGMLYAGFLEAPFKRDLMKALALLSVLVLAGSLFAVVLAIVGARSIFKPIEKLTSVVRATAAGQRTRVGSIPAGGEIGELSQQFDAMLDTLESHRTRIEQDAQLLEEKVQSRTVELKQQNMRLTDSIELLKQTRQQLATAEKLAALGELTAGVAHEINNPTAVILGNMDILIHEIGDAKGDVQVEIDLIVEQVYRIRSITDRLLQYSRSEVDMPAAVPESISVVTLVEDTLGLLSHEFQGLDSRVSVHHQSRLLLRIDYHEMQQVLLNLLRNAFESVSNAKPVEIHTRDVSSSEVAISVRDHGAGIDPLHLSRVFDPFFTAGKEQGTGLGLSVSYGIVRRHGGRIDVESTPGHGALFTVHLPAREGHSNTIKAPSDADLSVVG